MTIAADFVATLVCPPITEIIGELQRKDRARGSKQLALRNEVAPSDLYCYFGARFGAPNGVANVGRSNSSDNLIHWEWMMKTPPRNAQPECLAGIRNGQRRLNVRRLPFRGCVLPHAEPSLHS